MSLLLDEEARRELWAELIGSIERYTEDVAQGRVTPELAPRKIRALLGACDFSTPLEPLEALRFAVRALSEYQTHTPHPRYYGLFNPAPATMSIAADALVAAFNPQLAAWSHSPFAIEVEQHLIRCISERFGYDPETADGSFCSGGAEANHTALLTALTAAFPEFGGKGVRALPAQPVFYVSAESHHSFLKAARLCGIGAESVHEIAVDERLCLKPSALEQAIDQDKAAGLAPFLAVGTAGTTNAGAIDPLQAIASIAAEHGLWFHADAAWGGAAVLVPELKPLLAGIEHADSITFDAHKWMSVPMGAGLYLTRRAGILDSTFRTQTAYMPREAAGLDVIDPHLRTIQWSRRFTGLKLFLPLLVAGWEGYEEAISHQTAMGQAFRQQLRGSGWRIENDTPLPVICFSDPGGADASAVALNIVSSGEAWISTTMLHGRRTVLRACITNFRTGLSDIEAVVESLDRARTGVLAAQRAAAP